MMGPKTVSRPVAQGTESAPALIVQRVIIIYWLLIFEGAFRKWGFSSLHKFIFFIRDPFVLWVYFLAIRNGMWPRGTLFRLGFTLGLLFLPLGLLQAVTNDLNPMVVVYGWKMYFWYLPLAFIIGQQFRGKDLAMIFRHSLLIAIPMAVLVFLQYRSPPQALINQTYSAESTIMTVSRGIVRASGTFSVAAALGTFVGSTFSMALAAWLMPRNQRPLSFRVLVISSASVLVTLLLCGSPELRETERGGTLAGEGPRKHAAKS